MLTISDFPAISAFFRVAWDGRSSDAERPPTTGAWGCDRKWLGSAASARRTSEPFCAHIGRGL